MSDYWADKDRDFLMRHLIATWAEIGQTQDILAEALGYERDAPDGPEGGGFVIGEHNQLTLALQAASTIRKLQDEKDDLVSDLCWAEETLWDERTRGCDCGD